MSHDPKTPVDLVRWTFAVDPDRRTEIEAHLHDHGADVMVRGEDQLVVSWEEPEGNMEEIIEAISTVYHKDYYFNEHLSVTLIKQLAGNSQSGNAAMSLADFNEREIEVLRLVCQECSNQEIADKIFLSVRTVEGYRARLFEKTRSKNLVGLVIFAVKTGIISV